MNLPLYKQFQSVLQSLPVMNGINQTVKVHILNQQACLGGQKGSLELYRYPIKAVHTSHVSTATRVYLCSAAVTEVQFLLTASIIFTDVHSQVGLTHARCTRACPTSTLLKNTLTPAQPRCVSALAMIHCVRLREP